MRDYIDLPIHGGPNGVQTLRLPFNAAKAGGGLNGLDLSGARDRNGRPIQLTLSPADVHQPEEMSTYLAGYKHEDYRADEISEVVPVDHESDYYRTMSADNAFVAIPVKGSINGRINMIDPASSLALYTVIHRFIGTFVNDIVERNATKAYQPRQAAMEYVQTVLGLDREIDVITLVTSAANWATNQKVTLGAGFEWNDGPNSDPVKDIQNRMVASDQKANEIWMNENTGFTFLRHPKVRDHMRQMLGDGAAALASQTALPGGLTDFTLPGIGQVKISSVKKRNFTTGNNDYIWPDGVVAILRKSSGTANMQSVATTKTFRTRGPQGVGFGTRQYRVEDTGPEGGTMIVVHQADIAIMTGNNVGGLISNAIQ